MSEPRPHNPACRLYDCPNCPYIFSDTCSRSLKTVEGLESEIKLCDIQIRIKESRIRQLERDNAVLQLMIVDRDRIIEGLENRQKKEN